MIDLDTAWSLLLRAARSGGPRVGDVGAGLVLGPTGWGFDGVLSADAERRCRPLLPVLSAGVVAHLAQSLDGRIALPDGRSRWISGEADLEHTHRLRALCDAVVVGAHTVESDDPQLTVRRVPGPNPLRVVIDPHGRVGPAHHVFRDGAAPTLRITAEATGATDTLVLPARGGVIEPAAVVEALRARGVRRVLVEGGGVTVSRFVAAGCVDRLHLVIASVLVGAGRPGLSLSEPLAASLEGCPRPPTVVHPLGDDWLLDCSMSRR